jgi:predicted NBD/HSP70 family sugar kinase
MGILVAELEARGLVTIGDVRRGGTGRPGNQVRIRRDRLVALGIGLSDHYFNAVAVDLQGGVLATSKRSTQSRIPDPQTSIRELAAMGRALLDEKLGPRCELAGVGVAIPGLIDAANDVVRTIPGTDWRDVPIRDLLTPLLPGGLTGIHVQSAASLGALAEWQLGGFGVGNLVFLTGSGSVDAGFVIDGQVYRGGRGYAGEAGHMVLNPDGLQCSCGRRGCWQAEVGLNPVLARIAEPGDVVRDPTMDLDQRVTLLMQRARQGDKRTVSVLGEVGRQLGIGISNIVNLMNPEIVVVGGYIGRLSEWLLAPIRAEMSARVVAPVAGGCQVAAPTLGTEQAAVGGALAAFSPVLADPTLVPFEKHRSKGAANLAALA